MEARVLVKCSHCGNNQVFCSRTGQILNKYKECVYCGKKFSIHRGPDNSQVIKRL